MQQKFVADGNSYDSLRRAKYKNESDEEAMGVLMTKTEARVICQSYSSQL